MVGTIWERDEIEDVSGSFDHLLPVPDQLPEHGQAGLSLLAEENIKVIDLYDCFSRHDKEHHRRQWAASPYRLKNDPHLNEAGNQLMAVCLYRFLEEDAELPALSKAKLRAALQRYYAAFGGWMPGNTDRRQRIVVSPQAATGIRKKYTALERSDSLEKRLRQLAATPDNRMIDATFDVHLGETHLVYVKEGRCPTERQAPFFLHVTPREEKDLSPDRVQYGFNNLDFSSEGVELDATSCWVLRKLPDYAIRRISTGQYIPGTGRLWEGEFFVDQAPSRPHHAGD